MTQTPILIADSGSTKTDWLLLAPEGEAKSLQTAGLNPYMLADADIDALLRNRLLPALPEAQGADVRFYGAGCRGEQCGRLVGLLGRALSATSVEVESDLLGAARALCGNEAGWACILGTGSNSCLYDGRKIVTNVPPLGYVLGDEGSGAALGKRLVADAMKGLLPADLQQAFEAECRTTLDELLRRVYREAAPNRYLAGFAPFLHRHRTHPAVASMLHEEFTRFFRRNLRSKAGGCHTVHFVGSIACFFAEEVGRAAAAEGFATGRILRSPIDGLRLFHGKNRENS